MANEAKLINMFTLSETHPRIKEVMISRESYLDFFEKQFEEDRVLCVDGAEGVGVTTALALFAKRHADNCASYFNNGWSRHLLNPQIIVQSLLAQLSHYTKTKLNPQETETSLAQCLYKLSRVAKVQKKPLYFVFDGFNNIPVEYVDVIKNVLQPLFSLENGRFLFAGTSEGIKQIVPDSLTPKQSNKILPFQPNDVEGYLKAIDPGLDQDDIETIYDLSGKGVARRLAILTEKLQREGIEKIRELYTTMEDDFYAEDYEWIEAQDDRNLYLLMALLVFSERPLNRNLAMRTLKLDEKMTAELLERSKDYIEEEDGLIALKSDDYRKYLRARLMEFKTDIELLLIDQIEQSSEDEKFSYLPALYKHVKDKESLVNYLTSDNVQRYLEDKKSQAALNEQCEYGYYACSDFETQAGAYFRFAINRSVSREIEKNELTDAEIEALIAIGDDEQAYALTQNVFLLEERLKCLLIIAQAGKHLSDAMNEEIDAQITALSNVIDYAHIPDKALELAKLMMPVKMEKALDIIDQVAKVTKDQQQIDRLYTAISLQYNNEGKNDSDSTAKADLVNTKISDEGLRKMAKVMKSIMKDSTAEQVVAKMKELPTASSQLYFLRYWIPDHKDREDIGDAVEYAVKLVIETSATTMPKVSFLRLYCKPLPDMPEAQVRTVVGMLDAVVANIKFPTVEYVRLMILVISAVVKFDKKDAENRLQALYFEILELKDKALQAHCKAMLLKDYGQLGDKKDVEQWLASSYDLQDEIFDDVVESLKDSAYHLKVVEGPIKALVCDYPTFIKDAIAQMNTKERRDRAYLLAASEYVRQTDIKKFDWGYFIDKLYKQITYDESELYKPILDLVNKITETEGKDQKLFDKVQEHYSLFIDLEQAEMVCYNLSNLYVWASKNYGDEGFQDQLRVDLEQAWNQISVPWLQVNTGYNIAKVLSSISMKTEAREYVAKSAAIRKKQLLSSLSCVTAYSESLDLYAHSLGILIRSGLCREEDLEQFKILLSYDNSEGDAIIQWSRVALEYHGVGDREQFDRIMTNYVSKPLDKFAGDTQKRIMYCIAPALYLSLPTLFYTRVESYDTCFKNACIESIARYVQTKYPYPEYTTTRQIEAQVALEQKDYEILLDLVEHSEDENFIFDQTDFITRSISQNVGRKVSREIQKVVLGKLADIVKRRLPMKNGIQHNGYLISCLAMIEGKKPEGNMDAAALKSKIEAVGNKADQAFLYAHVAGYLKKTAEKNEFIELALKKTEEINYTFDKFNRYALCVQESFTAAPTRVKGIVKTVMTSMKAENNGTYSDYQRMLDLVRDHDEQLADSMLEMVDDDPARVQYKKMLKLRAASSKKIEAAKNDLALVKRLNSDEMVRFYDRQMESLIKNKNVVRDVNTTQSVIANIFDHPITDTQNAVLYFMENAYQRNQANGKFKVLLRDMHQAILYNLKIVLAIASGTKEKLERVNRILDERGEENENMIQVNENDKALKLIVEWYQEHPLDVLRIIDPHFHAEDLFVVKRLMDLNNSLKCFILTHKEEDGATLNELFQKGWNGVSSELPGRIEVKSCCYEDQPEKAPFHDRWWMLVDTDEEEYYGKRMASPSTFGSRITEISDMDEAGMKSAKRYFNRFFVNMVPKDEERVLEYEETKLK